MKSERLLTEKELPKVFVTYKNMLYGFILVRVQNQHDAEDLLSKTFIKFFIYVKKNPVRMTTLKNFIFTIASNTVNDFFRRKKIIRFIPLDKIAKEGENKTYYEFFKDTRNSDFISDIDKKNMLEKINKTAFLLPDKQKEAFYLRFIEGLAFADIAQIQKTPVATALSRVRYAVNAIKNTLNTKEIDQ